MHSLKVTLLLSAAIALLAVGGQAAIGQQNPPLRDAVECRERGGLPNVFAKWKAGKEVQVGYLGGSITEQNGWRPKTLAWFKTQYPAASTVEINAAIGGTGSDLGVYRVRQDVLDHKPDLLFVEFAVNDGGAPTDRILKAMEGIVRQTWQADPSTDICFVYTLTEGMLGDLEGGKFPHAASAMEAVADHYAIPSIHMGLEVAHLHQAGKLTFTGTLPKTDAERAALNGKLVFSPDGVHPYPETGHELYLASIERSFAKIAHLGKAGRHRLPAPLVADNWERAKLIPLSAVQLSTGWQKLDPATDPRAKQFQKRLPELWKTNKPGETITLRFKGTALLIYDLLGPDCGQVSVQFDDRPPVVSARFDAYSTYPRLATLPVADSAPDTIHTVTIRLLPDQPDKLKILHQRKENDNIKELDPKTYNDTAWYAGAVLLIGDLVK
ncbi:MAG: acyl-CoA thioesterase [Chthonomonadales bacterium]|nr:acyl-CoA thioesterase [Chthonomonadales bacterium]